MSIAYLAQAADHEQLEWLGGGVMRILLDGNKTGGQLTMLRSAAAGGSASPVHVHAREDEIVVLLQGSGIFWAGGHRYELSEGGVAFLPRNIPHAYRFTSQTVDMLAVCTPAGTEEFFRAAGWDLHTDVVVTDVSLRAQLIGRIETARYLGRVLANVPYGKSSSLRHIVGGTAGGGFEWTAGSNHGGLVGITALELDADQLITKVTSVYDSRQLSPTRGKRSWPHP